jgi:penicillin-binding protein 1A
MKKLTCAGSLHPVLAFVLVMILALPLGFYGTYLYLVPSLPDMEILKRAQIEMPMQVYTRDEKLLGEFGEKLSDPVRYKDIPPQMVHAFLAAEDASFFTHSGISFKGLGRALTEAVQSGSAQSGGSTITMQVAKNYYLSPERTIRRKLTEIFLARKIEQNLSKPEILTLYVNKIFLGQHAYGISAAARVYFNKPLQQLSIAEMAMIAGLPKAPSKYNPVANPERALERRNWIIGRMLQLGYISQSQYQHEIKAPVGLNMPERKLDFQAPYIAEMVRAEMVHQFGANVLNYGWRIHTTVSSTRQLAADHAIKEGLEDYDRRHGWRGAEANNKPLSDFHPVGDLLPARVTKVNTRSFEAQLANHQVITVPWQGMSWAHKYYNANRVGSFPNQASQIVALNDIVRVRANPPDNLKETDEKTWQLTQIPKVQGQLVALDPHNGAIEALIGGYDFSASKFNRSVQGWRQPGSTIKPFIYSLALERGYTPYSIVNDSPLQVGKWRPQNSDGRFMGAIPLRRALYLSRNLVSIRLLQAVGIERARDYLSDFGMVEANLPRNLTLALGTAQVVPMQIATGYAAFANGGYRIQPYFIQRIEDHDGKILFEADPARVCRTCQIRMGAEEEIRAQPINVKDTATAVLDQTPTTTLIQAVNAAPDGHAIPISTASAALDEPSTPFHQADRIMKAGAAYDMANILRDVIQHGTGRAALKLGRNDIGGKTGTTNDAKDAWFSGFQPNLVAVAWVGFDQPSTLGRREFGGIAALPIWSSFMAKALAQEPEAWVSRTGHVDTTNLKKDDLDKQADRDRAFVLAERRAKAPPMGIVIQRPRPIVVPAKPSVSVEASSIDPRLPVTRIAPNTTHSGSYTAPKPAGSVAPDQIF